MCVDWPLMCHASATWEAPGPGRDSDRDSDSEPESELYRHFKFKVGVTVTVIMIMMSVHRDSHWPPHARRPNGGKFSLRHRSRMIIKGCAAIIMMGMMMMWRCLAQGLNQAVPPSRASRQRKRRQPMC